MTRHKDCSVEGCSEHWPVTPTRPSDPAVNEAAAELDELAPTLWQQPKDRYGRSESMQIRVRALLALALATERDITIARMGPKIRRDERRNTVERIKREFRRPENMLTSFNAATPEEPQGFIKAYVAEAIDRILDEVAS